MADEHTPLIDALITSIGAAWPEVKSPQGIYLSLQMARVDWDAKASAGQLPVAVIDIDLEPTADYGVANRYDTGPVGIYYVAREMEPKPLLVKLRALRDSLWPGGLSPAVAQVLARPAVSFSASLPVTAYFLNTQKPFVCGAVIARILVGERLVG